MNKDAQAFLEVLSQTSWGKKIGIPDSKPEVASIKNAISTSINAYAALWHQQKASWVCLMYNDKEAALYAQTELENMVGKEQVLFYPASYLTPYQHEETANANTVLRAEVLEKLQINHQPYIVVTYKKALSEKVISAKSLKKNSFQIQVQDKINHEFLNELLFNLGFSRTDFVTQPGEFSIRGGILDVFSFSEKQPFRITFFGDEVEKIKAFDIETQLSVKSLHQFDLIPNLDQIIDNENPRIGFLDYFPASTLMVIEDYPIFLTYLDDFFAQTQETYLSLQETVQSLPSQLYLTAQEFQSQLNTFPQWQFGAYAASTEFDFHQTPQLSYQKNFNALIDSLTDKKEQGYNLYISFTSEKQIQRLQDIFSDLGATFSWTPWMLQLHQGFEDHKEKLLVFTDHQIFDRYQAYVPQLAFAKSESLTLKELTDLKIGDFITHIDHGVGKFMGLKKLDNNGRIQEAIKIVYLNNDILYVNIHSLHKISKFNGKDGKEPVLNKLGSPAWKTLKNKTKRKVKEVAFDLIQLYAKRKLEKGFAFSPDGYLQNELEASFMYEDTPDQEKATEDTKKDMESHQIMDRLICGDVGFGKTEVAIRAAFKAATDGKQTAILVPTTILAFQHFQSFTSRLQDFPVTIEYLNRFRSTKDKNRILEELASGKIDIVIGTHQLLGKQIRFKDLGLLIIDEEHKFGVSAKDKLKTLKANVDTLTLTATPIPRTLQFSLMAARDMSVIKTPPPNRKPVQTRIESWSEELFRDAIMYEMQRDGQVFFINNRIENLVEIAGMLQRLLPDASIALAHGQMEGKKMEKTLIDFMNGKIDVLLSTTIIESGLDVPNANTVFINNAHHFGLADLHQMRGRVGRSNRNAFCYLIAPPVSTLTQEARKRLQALEQFSDLGSGFQIAMKDLEIRGAGDMLGAEQSGFISDMGFDAYQKILQEAIQELKESDFKDLFADEKAEVSIGDISLEVEDEMMLPDEYINKVEERFSIYQRLSELKNPNQVDEVQVELEDRFGPLPTAAKTLLDSVKIKFKCQSIFVERLVLKNEKLLLYFPSNQNHSFYSQELFQKILVQLSQLSYPVQMKQKATDEGNQLYLSVMGMKDIYAVDTFLDVLLEAVDIQNPIELA